MGNVGKRVPRIDGLGKVCGQVKYVEDYIMPNCLVVKALRAEIAHGLVTSIDTSKARALEGVELVVTYEDVPDVMYSTAGHPLSLDPDHQDVEDKHILTRRVRFYGDEIAAVVACDERTAKKALKLIEVTYEEYEPILTVADALREGAPEIHEGSGNILASTNRDFGDIEAAKKKGPHVYEGTFHTSMVQHAHLETHGATAYLDEQNRVNIITPNQVPFTLQKNVATALGIPWSRVRIIKPYMGGGFGAKQDPVAEPLVAFLTLKLGGRPVRWIQEREECFISRVRHPFDVSLTSYVSDEGKIMANELEAYSINGAYASHAHAVAETGLNSYRMLYDYEAIRSKATTVYTNMPIAGAMRAYGVPQLLFPLECQLDDIARDLKIDPVDIRLLNINEAGYEDSLTGIQSYTTGLRQCLLKGRELIDWDNKKKKYSQQTETDKRRGLGVAAFCYQSNTYPAQLELSGSRVTLKHDGSIQLEISATELGQGSDTALAQICADAVGVRMDQVYVTSQQDTDLTPLGFGAYASRQTYVCGLAVDKASRQVKKEILEAACRMTNLDEHALDIREGQLIDISRDNKLVCSLEELAKFTSYHMTEAKPISVNLTNRTRANALAYGATFVEVEVDTALGKVEIIEIYNVHDSGKIINPNLAEGQVHGGVSMGLGYALYEELRFDEKTGRPLNNNLLDYKMMTTLDTPEIGHFFVETDEPSSSNGNKSLGEPPTITQAPAVRNAILDATGLALNRAPMTPQRVFQALADKK